MNKIFRKENLRPLIVLVAICVVATVLVASVNLIAAPILAEREQEKIREALSVVLPGGENFEKIELNEKYPKEIASAYKADIGYVFETNTKGKEFMKLLCGVDNDGKIVKLDVISESETPKYKNEVFPLVFGDEGRYNGKGSAGLDKVLVTGATLTSDGIYKAVKAALDAFTVANGGEISEAEPEDTNRREDGEVLELAMSLVPGAVGFTKQELHGEYNHLVSVYRENSGLGYVAYVVVISPNYGTVESEAVIHIGTDGKIKGMNKLVWKTSEAIYGYEPPTPDKVDAFYDRIPGIDSWTLDDVVLVTNATNTSGRVMDSVREALSEVDFIIREQNQTLRIFGIALVCAFAVITAGAIITLKRRGGGKA